MKFPKIQTPWSILTLSRKNTIIPSNLMLKINEVNISRYQLRPIMKNNLKSFFKTFHYSIDFFIPKIQLDFSDAFPGNFFLISFISVHREMISNNKNTSIFMYYIEFTYLYSCFHRNKTRNFVEANFTSIFFVRSSRSILC